MGRFDNTSPILTKEQIFAKRNVELLYSDFEYSTLHEKRMLNHLKKYDFFNTNSPSKTGQHFLYEIIKDKPTVDGIKYNCSTTYPKLGIYLNCYPCDQTIELEWVDHRRTWEYNFKIAHHFFAIEEQSELKYLPLWNDSMLIYGVWDKIPTWKELKPSYERTWWYYREQDELRDIQINRILNG